ncbi:hypothetical protein CP556_08625 [Natrinema sp. CBA1119]|uniref:hypothetical protein n=1 Tax=Natrinema sp. CBA1119 TaxID=1608465 RepID=UPI000BF39C8B|nr:hypothetical protein [Natrinema sp. CBA1119]PGF16170.1 hypothetical protein CP556_08625 [Natrinema sp. CBA1119]
MAMTQPNPDGHVSPQRAFDRLVWYNDRVCNGCFEHVREIEEFSPRKSLDVEERNRTPQASLEQGSIPQDEYGELESGQPMTTCRTCARVGCWADDDTLSKVQALRLIGPLAHRLREQGLEFDEGTLRKAVRLFKSREDVQGYDTEIFRRSVKLAAQRG